MRCTRAGVYVPCADIVMLDDDLEFEMFDEEAVAKGLPERREMGFRDYAKVHGSRWVHSAVGGGAGGDLLHERLVDWERWLRFKQPAMAAMCWGASGCRPHFWHAATCHSDHKIVAYHREALETLLPMPTHRDASCFWASQWSTNVELSLLYRGHWLYYPGAIRVRDVWGPGKRARYEKHAGYPKIGCGTNGSTHGAFYRIFSDLVHLATRHAWKTNSTSCFETHIQGCLRRWQGALDGYPALPKHKPYFWQPGSMLPAPCVDSNTVAL